MLIYLRCVLFVANVVVNGAVASFVMLPIWHLGGAALYEKTVKLRGMQECVARVFGICGFYQVFSDCRK